MKKIISIVLCAMMLLSVFPMTASAAAVGATPSYPVYVEFGENYYGGWNADTDHLNYYTYFELSKQGLLTISYTKPYDDEGEVGSMNIKIFDEDFNIVWSHQTSVETTSPKPTYNYTIGLKKGSYYINVTPGFTVTSGYIDFAHKYTFKATEYCETEQNNTAATATKLTLGKFYAGAFGTRSYNEGKDENDFFTAYVKKGVTYRFKIKDPTKLVNSSTILEFTENGERNYDVSLNSISNYVDANGYSYCEFVASYTGYVYFRMHNYSSTPIPYELGVFEVPKLCAAPKLSKVTNTTSGVKFSWGAVSGAEKYRVYRRTSSGEWIKLGDTTSTSFTDKTAKSGVLYYYTVRGVNGAGLGKYDKVGLSIRCVKAPKLTKIENSNKCVKITWGKVSGADGYIVYRKAEGESGWSKIATIKSGSTVTYKDTKVKSGKVYKYTVKAYDGSTYSAYNTSGIKIKYLAAPALAKVASTKSGVKFTWNAVGGAQGYVIYRKKGSGSWERLAKVTGKSTVSYLDKSAKKGVTYSYTVKAYNGDYSSYKNSTGLKIKDIY